MLFFFFFNIFVPFLEISTLGKDHLRHLFLFAIFSDFEDMAHYFWEEGVDHIAAALMASKIYGSLADQQNAINSEQKERLRGIKGYSVILFFVWLITLVLPRSRLL